MVRVYSLMRITGIKLLIGPEPFRLPPLLPSFNRTWQHTHHYRQGTKKSTQCFWCRVYHCVPNCDSYQKLAHLSHGGRGHITHKALPPCSWQTDYIKPLFLFRAIGGASPLRTHLQVTELLLQSNQPAPVTTVWPRKVTWVMCFAFWTIFSLTMVRLIAQATQQCAVRQGIQWTVPAPTIRGHPVELSFGLAFSTTVYLAYQLLLTS